MAGLTTKYQGIIPQHISPFFDWTYAQMGDVSKEGEDIHVVSEGNPFKGTYRLLVFEKDTLVGANLINYAEEAGIIKNAIIQKQEIGDHLMGFKPMFRLGK
ncbi:MAG: hypothetical protein JRC68_09165 [Deltaproteobacteria bacterium]|nr:hypothetical protein [Deltaproteobacteria bacterium]